MAENNVNLQITFETQGAVKAAEKFGDSVNDTLYSVTKGVDEVKDSFKSISKTKVKPPDFSGLNGALDGVKNTMKNLATAAVAYLSFRTVESFFTAIVEESIDAENKLNELNAALKRTGNFTQETSDAMAEFANEMMKTTTIDDDVINQQVAMAFAFTNNAKQARAMVRAAADLSAAMGIDLGTATEYLGKTLDGTAGRLNELVPELKGVSAEALKAGGAIDIVAEKFGGAAASKIDTFSGAIAQAKNNIGNFLAALGDSVTQNPMIIQGIKEISGAIAEMTGKKQSFEDLINDGILGLVQALEWLVPRLESTITFFKVIAFSAEFLLKSIMNLIDGLKALGNQIAYVFSRDKSYIQDNIKLFDDIKKRADDLATSFENLYKNPIRIDEKKILSSINRIKSATSKPIQFQNGSGVSKTGGAGGAISPSTGKEIAAYIEDPLKNADKSRLEFIGSFTEGLTSAVPILGEFTGLVQGAGDGLYSLGQGAIQFGKDLISGAAQIGKVAFASTVGGIARGKDGAENAVIKTTGALGSLVDKIAGTGSLFGDTIETLLTSLSNPENLNAMINGFIDAIPSIIDSFIANLPTLIDGIISALPVLFAGIIELIPTLFDELARLLPEVLVTLANALPQLIIVLAENIGTVIEAIAEKSDVIIMAIVAALPKVAVALGKAALNIIQIGFTKLLPNIAKGIVDGFLQWFDGKEIEEAFEKALSIIITPLVVIGDGVMMVASWVESVWKALYDLLGGEKTTQFGTDTAQSFNQFVTDTGQSIKAVGKVFGLATGGVVPSGYPNDSYPALLTSGETVLPPQTSGNLFNLIDSMANGNAPNGNNETNALLRQMIALMSSQQTTVNVQLDRNTLAKAIIGLNTDNRRLA